MNKYDRITQEQIADARVRSDAQRNTLAPLKAARLAVSDKLRNDSGQSAAAWSEYFAADRAYEAALTERKAELVAWAKSPFRHPGEAVVLVLDLHGAGEL